MPTFDGSPCLVNNSVTSPLTLRTSPLLLTVAAVAPTLPFITSHVAQHRDWV